MLKVRLGSFRASRALRTESGAAKFSDKQWLRLKRRASQIAIHPGHRPSPMVSDLKASSRHRRWRA